MQMPIQSLRTTLIALLWSASFLAQPLTGLAQTTSQVLALDGIGDYVTIPSAADLQNPTEITLEAWIYPLQGSQNNESFINKSDNSVATSSRTFELTWVANADSEGPGNSLRFIVFFALPISATQPPYAVISAQVLPGTWTHIAATYDTKNSGLRLYTNGVMAAASTTFSGQSFVGLPLRQTTLPVLLGRGDYPPYFYARGYMDEVRIWNTVRSAGDIAASMFCRLTGTEAGLAGYWNFDAGSPGDLTGHGHDGVMEGNTQIQPVQGVDLVHQGGCGPTPAGPFRAKATSTITSGFLTGIVLTDHGSGYTNTPIVTIVGDGTGAKAIAVVSNGSVTSVIILSSGSAFTSPPLIFIDPPVTTPSLSIEVSSVAVSMNVVTGRTYQLDSSFNLRNWQPAGEKFTADTDSISRIFEVGITGQYFRVREIP